MTPIRHFEIIWPLIHGCEKYQTRQEIYVKKFEFWQHMTSFHSKIYPSNSNSSRMWKISNKTSNSHSDNKRIFEQCSFVTHWEFQRVVSSKFSHSRMGHYFFSYLLTWEVDLIEILEIMAQMWQYVIFLSLKPTKVTSDFILY